MKRKTQTNKTRYAIHVEVVPENVKGSEDTKKQREREREREKERERERECVCV